MNPDPQFPITPRFVVGLIAIAIGVLFILDQASVLVATDFLPFWPIGLAALGLSTMLTAANPISRVVGAAAIFFAAFVPIQKTFEIELPFSIWPVLLIFVGVYVLGQSLSERRSEPPPAAPEEAPTRKLMAFSVMGDVSRRVFSPFRGASLTAIMGAVGLDLREAIIEGEEAIIDCHAVMGGIEIRVPPDWDIVTQMVPIMGELGDKATKGEVGSKRLVVRGLILMGSVEIKN